MLITLLPQQHINEIDIAWCSSLLIAQKTATIMAAVKSVMLYNILSMLFNTPPRRRSLGPFLPTDSQLHITDYPVGAVSEQSLVYWTVPKRLFNYSKIVSKSTTPLLRGG